MDILHKGDNDDDDDNNNNNNNNNNKVFSRVWLQNISVLRLYWKECSAQLGDMN